VIQRRLAEARGEAARWGEFDFLVLSGSRDEDLRRMKVILEAERLRRSRSRFEFAA
jgi:guanylate kinase